VPAPAALSASFLLAALGFHFVGLVLAPIPHHRQYLGRHIEVGQVKIAVGGEKIFKDLPRNSRLQFRVLSYCGGEFLLISFLARRDLLLECSCRGRASGEGREILVDQKGKPIHCSHM
jgi:hypothetical protein